MHFGVSGGRISLRTLRAKVARVGDSAYAASRLSARPNPQIPSRLALSLSRPRLRSVARVARRLRPTPPRPSATKTPKSLLVSLSLSGSRLRSVARVARRLQLRRLRGLPATKTPKSLLVSLSALRLETCGVWRAWLGDSSYAAFAAFLPSQSSWDRSWGPTTPNLGLGLGSAQGSSSLFDKAGVSLFLRSSSSSSASAASSVDSAASNLNSAFCEVFWLCDLRLHGDDVYFSLEDFGFGPVMGLKLKLGAKIRIQRFGFWVVLIFLGNSVLLLGKPISVLSFCFLFFPDRGTLLSVQSVTLSIGDWFFDRVGVSAIDCPYPCDNTCHNLRIENIINQQRNQRRMKNSVSDPLLIRDGSETECKNSVSDSVSD
ncbi:hypothetical protein Syun_025973 [Stephania yunnanensis]|uniref:Uncharacterized protein n=1 Tax=Stephania yunnanensis TaxID=152371 RepID=A0AAP0EY52_9MAGN